MKEQEQQKVENNAGSRADKRQDGRNGEQAAARTGRKPLKVLSTSLGIALAANLLAMPAVNAEGTDTAKPQPKLVEWSSDAVKGYFDPGIDWNLVLPEEKKDQGTGQSTAGTGGAAAAAGGATTGAAASTGGGGTNTVIVNSGGGFGWEDLLLYHLLFNNGGVYSTSSWSQSHTTVYANNRQPYQPRSYTSGTFQSKPVAGSAVRAPQTTASSGSFSTSKSTSTNSSKTTTGSVSSGGASSSTSATAPSTSTSSGSFSSSASSKSSSTSSGSIGGKSGGFSSSGSSSSGS